MTTAVVLLLVATALVVACGIFVAAEFAFLAADRPTVARAAEAGDRRARGAQAAFRTLSTQLSGVQLGITVTNLAIGYLAEPSIAVLVRGPVAALGFGEPAARAVSVGLALVLATGLTMLFGELVPKNLAIAEPVRVTYAVQGVIRGWTRVMSWPIRGLNGLANAILHRFGLEAKEELASARSADELVFVVRRSESQGTLGTATAALLQRALAFGDKRAADVLTPRVRMRTVAASAPVAEVIEAVRRTGHSRFPVVGEGPDDVVGIVHVKQAVAVPEDRRGAVPVRDVMAPAVLVPTTVDLDGLLDRLQEGGFQMAVVVDEFGGTDGVVTLEDLLEELVGEVLDEHDRSATYVRQRPGGAWSVSGLLRPDEVGAATGIALPEDGSYETVGGLVTQRLGRVPVKGDAVDVDGHRLTVERMDGRRVDRVHLAPVALGEVEAVADAGGATGRTTAEAPR